MTKLFLFPCNGNAREAVGVVKAANDAGANWDLLGFVDDAPGKQSGLVMGLPVFGREAFAIHPSAQVLAAPGRSENFRSRPEIIEGLGLDRERWATVIHPRASVGPDCEIGVNVLLMAGVVLTCQARLSDHVVILPNTVVSHDARLEDYVMLGSGVCLSGGVLVGKGAYVGSGARIIQGATIGEGALVGLGAVVIHDVAPGQTVAGVPARAIRGSQG